MRAYLCCLLFLIGVGSSADADTLVLANGDEINGEIIEWAVDHVVIEHPQLGRLRFELGELELDTGKPPSRGLFGTRFLRGWKRRLDLGINGEQSNESTFSATFGTKFAYKDEWTRWNFNGRYFYNLADDDDDDNNATTDLTRDWLTPGSRWFTSLAVRYQFDQFQAWKHRATIFAAPGLHLIATESHTLDLRVGPAFTREFGSSKDNKAEGSAALAYDWQISERHSLDIKNQYFAEVEPDPGEFRNFSTLAWSLRLTESPVLNLNLGLQNEYDSDPEPGDDKNDLKYFLTLGVEF